MTLQEHEFAGAAEAPPHDVAHGGQRFNRLAPLAAVLITLVLGFARLLWTPSFYFKDDTQAGTIGQWYGLGTRLLSGEWPLLNPHAWTAGNYLAEGQWGLYSPPIWLISIISTTGIDLLVLVTVVKVLLLATMTYGIYLLAKSFGAAPVWAALAGVLAPLSGFTVYMDASSWTMGLFAAAVFPFAWWGLRRLVEDRRSPIAFLLASATLITLGYVFGVMLLVVVLVESLIRHGIRRDRRAVLTILAASVFSGLLTIVVYLPAVLTAPVTIRGSWSVFNAGFLNADLGDLAATATATTTASVGAWGTSQYSAPLLYIAWLLPLFGMLLPAVRADLRRLVPVFVFGLVTLLLVTGPSHVGAIRWPIRFMPYLVLAVLIVFAVFATRAFPHRIGRRGLGVSLIVLAAMSWFSTVIVVSEWRRVAVSAALQLVGILVFYAIARWRAGEGMDAARRTLLAGATGAGIAALLLIPQMTVFPTSPLPQLGVVTSEQALTSVLDDGVDDAIVVGDIYAGWDDAQTYSERLVANQWYFSSTQVSSLYTVLPHEAYVTDVCADLRGSTCAALLDKLWSVDDETGTEVATLLGVNTIVAIKASFPDGMPPTALGWRVMSEGEYTTVFVREDPVPTAGGLAWKSEGTSLSVLEQTNTGIVLRVDELGADPEAVLSRLNWPGYTIDGAEWGEPVRDYLLRIDLSEASVGDTIAVEFRPPGWTLEVGMLVLAGITLIGWPILAVIAARRARARQPTRN